MEDKVRSISQSVGIKIPITDDDQVFDGFMLGDKCTHVEPQTKFEKLKMIAQFASNASKPNFSTKTESLEKYDPKLFKKTWIDYCLYFWITIGGIAVVLYIIISNISLLQTEKSINLQLNKLTDASYPMTGNLLPIHQISYFVK